VKVVPRACSVCGGPDHVSSIEGDKVHHSVTIELRYLKERQQCTPNHEAHGWRFRIHQGRNAMERFICRRCLKSTEEMSKEFRLKREKELGRANHDPYYLAVCGE
jgi:hypothetical protein